MAVMSFTHVPTHPNPLIYFFLFGETLGGIQ